MYHDQALIPLKTIDFDGGVNITLGLPFVRTSPTTAPRSTSPAPASPMPAACARPWSWPARSPPAATPARSADARPSPPSERPDSLPPLREVIARHGIGARKGLGQHFLFDLNLTRRIARAAGDIGSGTVIEIGPGPGGLTRALLECGAGYLLAIERDDRCAAALAEIAAVYPGRLEVVMGDALRVDPVERTAAPGASSPTCPTTSRPRCCCAGWSEPTSMPASC